MPRTASPAPRHRLQADLVQAAIVALLCERECHGYELLSRLDELGICPGTVALYRTLRSMEGAGTVCSSWECPAQARPAAPTHPPTGLAAGWRASSRRPWRTPSDSGRLSPGCWS